MTDKQRRYLIMTRLRTLRALNRMTLSSVAEALEADHSTVASWESGRTVPNAIRLAALCTVYGCSADWVLGLTDRGAHDGGK